MAKRNADEAPIEALPLSLTYDFCLKAIVLDDARQLKGEDKKKCGVRIIYSGRMRNMAFASKELGC
jgi:hypothetical protein